ncbi:MAG: manganese efflux pump, partial [Eubacteriales bacterium]
WIPWIALALLRFIGGKMLIEGIRDLREKRACEKAVAAGANAAAGDGEGAPAVSCEIPHRSVGIWALMVQGIATSIDALSVGFTIAENPFWQASVSALIIGVVTFGICLAGVLLGKRFGTSLSAVATVVGGGILIAIGIEIFVKGMWF